MYVAKKFCTFTGWQISIMKKLPLLTGLIQKLQLDKTEWQEVKLASNTRNLSYLRNASFVVIVLGLVHILYFLLQPDSSVATEFNWRIAIIFSHVSLVIVFSAFLFLIKVFQRDEALLHKYAFATTIFAYIFILLIGAGISLIDQQVTAAITPFIIACVAASLLLLIPPLTALFCFLFSWLIFIFLLPYFQVDSNIILSNNVNALSGLIIGLFLAFNRWFEYLKRYRQLIIIKRQQYDLEERNAELQNLTANLKQANAQKDKLFSIIAHDLRSPFNTLIGSSDLLVSEEFDLSEKETRVLKENIRKTAQSTFFLLENLLGWSRLQQQKITPIKERTNLTGLIKSVLNEINPIASGKEVEINAIFDEDYFTNIDPTMIQLVIRNLLMNAIKFSHRKSAVLISIHKEDNEWVTISVKDQGIGMSDIVKNSLFKAETIKGRSGTEKELSTGLGLVLCKDFVSLHKGHLWVESEERKGSTFYFTLPLNLVN